MQIKIQSSTGMPITRQIAQQIRAQCASGMLRPGARLPSVRELAKELTINQNTVLRVYERLTMEGLLERRQGDGTFVAGRLPAGQMRAQRELLNDEVERLVRRAATLGISAERLHELVNEAVDRMERGARVGQSK
jgi:GntR family transcriptional regulator